MKNYLIIYNYNKGNLFSFDANNFLNVRQAIKEFRKNHRDATLVFIKEVENV